MSKVRKVLGKDAVAFYCPGCRHAHAINLKPPSPVWTYNSNPDFPTFHPSIHVIARWSQNDPTMADESLCHSFVENGYIKFLSDCTHSLAGQTVLIPQWPHAPGQYGGIEE